MKRLEKGFTLIELMIVVAIIAILAAVAAPKFGAQIKKSKDAKGLSLVGNWRSASQLHYSDDGIYAGSYADLADNVDDTTLKASFTANTLTTPVSASTSVTAIYIEVGTAGTNQLAANTKKEGIMATYNTTDGSIAITGGTTAKNTATVSDTWETK